MFKQLIKKFNERPYKYYRLQSVHDSHWINTHVIDFDFGIAYEKLFVNIIPASCVDNIPSYILTRADSATSAIVFMGTTEEMILAPGNNRLLSTIAKIFDNLPKEVKTLWIPVYDPDNIMHVFLEHNMAGIVSRVKTYTKTETKLIEMTYGNPAIKPWYCLYRD